MQYNKEYLVYSYFGINVYQRDKFDRDCHQIWSNIELILEIGETL